MFKHLLGILAAGSALVITVAAGVVAIPFVVFGIVTRKLRKKNTELLVLFFLSSCLWAVPGMAKGDSNDGLRVQGVSRDPCSGTAFAARFSGDSVRCFTSVGPLTFIFPPHPAGNQAPVPFLIDNTWYFNKSPLQKNQDRFSNEVRPFKEKQHLSAVDYILMISMALAALIITWANLKDWEKEYRDDKENLV